MSVASAQIQDLAKRHGFTGFDQHEPLHRCTEHVPFRLTPNMQHFITPTGVEGLLTSAVMAMARSLTNPEFDLPSCLTLFLRDEVGRAASG